MFLLFSCSANEKLPVDYVDPFICTQGDHGQWLPAALVPFGMIELCPDTYPGSLTADGDFAHSGYDYSDKQLRSFSHFHVGSSGGTSIGDRAGLFSMLPFTTAEIETLLKNPIVDFDKNSEKVRPGYYSVHLPGEDIFVELTAAAHSGYHKYHYPADKEAQLIISSHPGRVGGITLSKTGPQKIEGILSVFDGIYFIIEFNSPLISTQLWDGRSLVKKESLEKESNVSLVCNFGNLKGKPLEIRVGVSLISIEGARKNLESEWQGGDFSKALKKASCLWNETLSIIEVKGQDEEDKTIFYTALYHSCFMPNAINDIDGKYPGLDHKIHMASGYRHYNNYAFWDDFRTKFPLYSLFQPELYRDVVTSLCYINEQADNFAPFPYSIHGPTNKSYSPHGINGFYPYFSVRHEHMLMVITDAYFKGLCDVSSERIYPIIKREALLQLPERYDSIGYIPARPDRTGECCWDNYCVALVAKDVGNQKDYEYFKSRADYWKNTWDPTIRFFRARAADGSWLDFPEDPAINREKYTYEGTKWQWRWNVLHDVPAMIEAFGGNGPFIKELECFFEKSLYTAGNQPDLQAPFLFNFAGAPWLTQKWVRNILKEPMLQRYGTHDLFPQPIFGRIYKATPDGYLEEMDDDYGCMAAWYAMSSMGLYQVCPGNPVYQITAPIFDEVTINLKNKIYNGNKFKIIAKNLSKDNYFIQSATLNGQPFNRTWLSHKEIADGGKLVFIMGPEPNKKWGVN